VLSLDGVVIEEMLAGIFVFSLSIIIVSDLVVVTVVVGGRFVVSACK